jgi:hypothetical protein
MMILQWMFHLGIYLLAVYYYLAESSVVEGALCDASSTFLAKFGVSSTTGEMLSLLFVSEIYKYERYDVEF